MTRTINVQETATLIADRQYYLDKGYPYHIANQYAYDHQYASKSLKFKEN